MANFSFNKLYVIESLDSTEKKTGTELYNDLLRWKEFEHKDKLSVELIEISNKNNFIKCLKRIELESLGNDIYPILHLEIHGSQNLDGLVLNSGELVGWNDIYSFLININSNIGNNLFLTLAVCHGAYLMQLIKLDRPAPFWGFIGSFETINVSDLMLRYYEFYKEFLDSFNLNLAFDKLQKSNPNVPSTYRFISSETTFKEVYQNYFEDNTSEKGIAERKKQVQKDENLKFTNRQERRDFEKKFAKQVKETKGMYLKKHRRIFFMFDKFPKNKDRFK